MTTHVTDPVEVLMLLLMYRWERTAPPDKHQAVLGGKPARNTQTARLVHTLKNIAVANGSEEDVYQTLSLHTRRVDGQSYVSRDPSWMEQPTALGAQWFFEGCTSLVQKQAVLHHLTKLGLSSDFGAAAEAFVAGSTVEPYLPTEQEEGGVLVRLHEKPSSPGA